MRKLWVSNHSWNSESLPTPSPPLPHALARARHTSTVAFGYPVLARNAISVQTRAAMSAQEIASFVSNRREAASILEKKAAGAKGREDFYMRFWRVLGWIAQVSFISGFAFLVTFAAKNT